MSPVATKAARRPTFGHGLVIATSRALQLAALGWGPSIQPLALAWLART